MEWQLQKHAVEAALEKSKRGGHLWIFFETPVLAREARIYIYHVAAKLDVQIKGAGLAEGIEIFPKQDEVRPNEFGNAIRAPLGVHRGARDGRGWRYWYQETGCGWVAALLCGQARVCDDALVVVSSDGSRER